MNYSKAKTFYKRYRVEIKSIIFVICIILAISFITITHYKAESNRYSFMAPAIVKDIQEKYGNRYEMILEVDYGDETKDKSILISRYEYLHYKVGDRLIYNTDTDCIVNYEE